MEQPNVEVLETDGVEDHCLDTECSSVVKTIAGKKLKRSSRIHNVMMKSFGRQQRSNSQVRFISVEEVQAGRVDIAKSMVLQRAESFISDSSNADFCMQGGQETDENVTLSYKLD